MMIYNTDYDQIQIFTKTAWSGITGNKDLGIECASAMDCGSGFCVDSVCCDTSPENCNGDCEACNLAGNLGYCTVRAALDNTEVTTTCNYCNGVSNTSLAYTGRPGVNCNEINDFCYSGSCLATFCDEDNDGHYTEVSLYCPSGRTSLIMGDDCDDSCPTCFPGSTATTPQPDGLDQDCINGIDNSLCVTGSNCGPRTCGAECSTGRRNCCQYQGGTCAFWSPCTMPPWNACACCGGYVYSTSCSPNTYH